MFRDARKLDDGAVIEADVCIVGAGPAGLALAMELDGAGVRACVIESGGLGFDRALQRLSRLAETESVIRPAYFNRRRQVGGNAHLWRMGRRPQRSLIRYLPLDDIDFEQRSWVSHSGWPFGRAELEPYYARAHALLRLGPPDYDLSSLVDGQAQPLPLGAGIRTSVERFGDAAPFLDHSRLRNSKTVSVWFNATAGALSPSADGARIDRIAIDCLTGRRHSVRAETFILAAGGIENPRLLLLSDERQSVAVGNRHDVVGRYFMDHLHVGGVLTPSTPQFFAQARLYDIYRHSDGREAGCKLNLDQETMRREELLNAALKIDPEMPPGIEALDTRLRLVLRRGQLVPGVYGWSELPAPERRFRRFAAYLQLELPPLPDNRVTLGHETDVFGRRLPRVQWTWDPLTLRSARRTSELLSQAFQRSGLGALAMAQGEPPPLRHNEGLNHHMGATRMHEDPRYGVVDADCRVHGVSNLFVAGSSVFPTGGYANPTLTIVALAIRLADHVKQQRALAGARNR